ncbi:unnamed protein product [Durusdinium trenchii]|uniref:Acyltransferase 3 domain-containing protein n=2 Tax=Durusdinium trenchii TaxID=1381693 RepID=A0ABP0SW04_9DINO
MDSPPPSSRVYENIFQSLPIIQNAAPPSPPEPLSWQDDVGLSLCFVAILTLTAVANVFFCIPRRSDPASPAASEGVSEAQQGLRQKEGRVDTHALTGLRGFAALHVALGHYCAISPVHVDLIGGASMSFFYLLSGFVMTLGYAKDLVAADSSSNLANFNKRRFWRNRFARLFPMYMLTNIVYFLVLHFSWQGPGMLSSTNFDWNLALTFLGLNMWIYPLDAWLPTDAVCCQHQVALPSNFVTWTVQTMAVFYIVFPYMLPWLKAVKRRRLVIHMLFWLQAVTFLSIVSFGVFALKNFNVGYWSARAWPLSRIPVFAMGCLAAVERIHGGGHVTCRFRTADAGGEARRWGWRASVLGACYVLILTAGVVLNEVPVKSATFARLRDPVIRSLLEALVPLLFIDLILALTHCGESGILARVCRSKPMEWMGDIAMSFYMVHFSVILIVSMFVPQHLQAVSWWMVVGSFALAMLLGSLAALMTLLCCPSPSSRHSLRGAVLPGKVCSLLHLHSSLCAYKLPSSRVLFG